MSSPPVIALRHQRAKGSTRRRMLHLEVDVLVFCALSRESSSARCGTRYKHGTKPTSSWFSSLLFHSFLASKFAPMRVHAFPQPLLTAILEHSASNAPTAIIEPAKACAHRNLNSAVSPSTLLPALPVLRNATRAPAIAGPARTPGAKHAVNIPVRVPI